MQDRFENELMKSKCLPGVKPGGGRSNKVRKELSAYLIMSLLKIVPSKQDP